LNREIQTGVVGDLNRAGKKSDWPKLLISPMPPGAFLWQDVADGLTNKLLQWKRGLIITFKFRK
jgi:hypothetical protein